MTEMNIQCWAMKTLGFMNAAGLILAASTAAAGDPDRLRQGCTDCEPHVTLAASDSLDWLLYKPNTDYLNFPRGEPGYREPGDPPYVPEPLPRANERSAVPPDHDLEAAPGRSGSRWRKGYLACEVVRKRIAEQGYTTVRATNCAGDTYRFTAKRGGTRVYLSARARDGQILRERPAANP